MRVCSNFASSGETFGDAAGTTDGLANPASTAAVDDAGGAGCARVQPQPFVLRRSIKYVSDELDRSFEAKLASVVEHLLVTIPG